MVPEEGAVCLLGKPGKIFNASQGRSAKFLADAKQLASAPHELSFAPLKFAAGESRTPMRFPPQDFESCASANSATAA